ncbi:MAG: S46 family peptidase, partial [Planctomycetaceae bacterium]|nr:S46 family peptidase [Planctomycetaceae bacterium]
MNAFIRVLLMLVTVVSSSATADEGMWLFSDLPKKLLKQRYEFEPTDDWARHVMLSSVRFNVGGSGSFVSSTGLVLTNHHVASDTLYKLSSAERNIAKDGYLASGPESELKAPDLELNVLTDILDVTERVRSAVAAGLSADEAAKARRAVMAEIEKESLDATGLRSDVVTLYGGEKFHLYRYRKYTDVRLVWAPEAAIAFFGGDADNFEYPRYCLDVTLFRVYENDRPAKIEHFLQWAETPVAEEDLVFVSGNPGRTQRLFTVDALKHLRDVRNPYVLDFLRRKEILLQQFGLNGQEQKRRAQDDLFGIQNSRKAYTGMLNGLQNPSIIAAKLQSETDLLKAVRGHSAVKHHATAWEEIAQLQHDKAKLQGTVYSFRSRLYDLAETLVLMAAEDLKPSADRLREFRESARESLEQDLFSTAPIYEDLERVKLADELARLTEKRGRDDSLVSQVLNGKSPADRAAELIGTTKLIDVDQRRALASGGKTAIEESPDPLIRLAQLMEPELRAYRERSEALDEAERQAYARISEATVAVSG